MTFVAFGEVSFVKVDDVWRDLMAIGEVCLT